MERALSVPARGAAVHPFWSDRVRADTFLQASRPFGLPVDVDVDSSFEPVEGIPVSTEGSFQASAAVTGKGRGEASTGMIGAQRSTASGGNGLKTEGRLPDGNGRPRTMGPVKPSTGNQMGANEDGLHRALEREVADHLREENSRLVDELMFLRGKLENRSAGVESSRWYAVGGVESNLKNRECCLSSLQVYMLILPTVNWNDKPLEKISLLRFKRLIWPTLENHSAL